MYLWTNIKFNKIHKTWKSSIFLNWRNLSWIKKSYNKLYPNKLWKSLCINSIIANFMILTAAVMTNVENRKRRWWRWSTTSYSAITKITPFKCFAKCIICQSDSWENLRKGKQQSSLKKYFKIAFFNGFLQILMFCTKDKNKILFIN